ncbi:Cys-tRNA(Pro) deacylase [Carnobacterium divergens]|uniref:Cys-tRNA(Pro) deacylase n=1 Tax=Carnobacterium divergens TaxID=2748 RepID=UPI0007F48164|nr:Cys-tRNA(Pro) deacylase [Carnobacterium divergens]TFJ43390.1 Cys-tRNA(Pro) deacylase [Carnobacterium divergens]TFJ50543.1 Cys-tRNA(Pro) deacylase [Carnobacterium divergens]SBO18389.1 tRNA editing protein [Carnobacterium divergens]
MKAKKGTKTNACRMLDQENIQYQMYEFPWSEDHIDAKSVAEKLGIATDSIYKTLVTVGDKTGILVACISGGMELDLKALAKVSGNKKVEMLPMKELEKTTGYIRGGCSPIGMKKLFPTFIQKSAELEDEIIVSAGKRGMQLALNPKELALVTKARFVAIHH